MIEYVVICVKESGILIKISKSIFSWLLVLSVLLCSFGCDILPNESDSESITEGEIFESDTVIDESTTGTNESEIIAVETNESTLETESDIDETESESDEWVSSESDTVPPLYIYESENSTSTLSPATSFEEAISRSELGQLSGYDYVPDQAPNVSKYRPKKDGMYIKNNDSYYIDNNTYVVIDAYGREVFRIYRGGAYITLEEVAAYIYAFGEPPANHSSSKRTKPTQSIWGIYLRINNTKFSGDTTRYPYEPVLPRISGCGGDLQYWEMDIGTTGNDCDPSYSARIYNNGVTIVRGASRLVYTWNDLNSNGLADTTDAIYIFYTYNHYNDFQEYLNYYGGWGDMFGNITGGGEISSKTNYNPTPYIPTIAGSIVPDNSSAASTFRVNYVMYAWVDIEALKQSLVA